MLVSVLLRHIQNHTSSFGPMVSQPVCMQVFHVWFTKSWDRMLCWYNKLIELENGQVNDVEPIGLISSEKKESLQVSSRCFQAQHALMRRHYPQPAPPASSQPHLLQQH